MLKKKAYLDAAQAALNDRNALPEVRLAADNYSASLTKALSNADAYQKAAESILQPVDVVTTRAGDAILGASVSGLAGVMGALLAWVGGSLIVSGARRVPDAPVALAVDIMDPLEEYEEDVPTLSEPLQGTQWFAFLTVRPDESNKHVQALPPYRVP
jgi:hypothetical protein